MEKCVSENVQSVQTSRGGAQPAVEWNIEVALVKQQGERCRRRKSSHRAKRPRKR